MLLEKIKILLGGKPDVSLALGGGAVLGAAHIGVLKAVEESGIKVNAVSGTSIGALIAALYAFGKTADEIEEIALRLKWFDVGGFSLSQFGLLSNSKMGNLIRTHLGECNIEDAQIPLSIVATDITTGEMVILKEGSVAEAVMASSCLPGIFIPVTINGRMLVDGGVVENVPVTPLKKAGYEFIAGVDLNMRNKDHTPHNIFDILFNSFSFMIMTTTRYLKSSADMIIEPDLCDFDLINTDHVAEIMKAGYKEAKKQFMLKFGKPVKLRNTGT